MKFLKYKESMFIFWLTMKLENEQILQYFQTHLLNTNQDLNSHFKAITSKNFI